MTHFVVLLPADLDAVMPGQRKILAQLFQRISHRLFCSHGFALRPGGSKGLLSQGSAYSSNTRLPLLALAGETPIDSTGCARIQSPPASER